MKVRNLAPAVALLVLSLLFSTGAASAQNQNRVEGHTTMEVHCQLSDGRDEPTALPAGTMLWIPDPLVESEDGLSWWVGIANPTGGRSSMCWMSKDLVAYGIPESPIYYDGYGSDDVLPTDTPIGETFVNTEGVACEPNPWPSSEPTAHLPQGMWATKLASEVTEGWQLVFSNDAQGLLVRCYVEERYLGEQTVIEPEQPAEETPEVEPVPAPEPLPEVYVSEPAYDEDVEATDMSEAADEADNVYLADDEEYAADEAAPNEESPESPEPSLTDGPPTVTNLPNTGTGDGIQPVPWWHLFREPLGLLAVLTAGVAAAVLAWAGLASSKEFGDEIAKACSNGWTTVYAYIYGVCTCMTDRDHRDHTSSRR